MEDPAVNIYIGIFDNLWSEEVVLHEFDVGALVFRFHVFSYIDILDDKFERGVCIRYSRACKSICSSDLKSLIFLLCLEVF